MVFVVFLHSESNEKEKEKIMLIVLAFMAAIGLGMIISGFLITTMLYCQKRNLVIGIVLILAGGIFFSPALFE